MYLCNEQITIYNRFTNAETKRKEYVPTLISGIHWFGTDKVTVTSDGLVSAKQYTLRIPIDADFEGKQYVSPKEYEKLSGSRPDVFTFDEGDIIVYGDVVVKGTTPSELQKDYDIVTVVSVTDNRNAPNAKHWRVVGK